MMNRYLCLYAVPFVLAFLSSVDTKLDLVPVHLGDPGLVGLVVLLRGLSLNARDQGQSLLKHEFHTYMSGRHKNRKWVK